MELPGKQLTLLQDTVKYGKCSFSIIILMLENTEGTIQRNWQHIGYTRRRDNPEKLATYRVHKTVTRQRQSRETGNI